jgi:hypothetical protein
MQIEPILPIILCPEIVGSHILVLNYFFLQKGAECGLYNAYTGQSPEETSGKLPNSDISAANDQLFKTISTKFGQPIQRSKCQISQ